MTDVELNSIADVDHAIDPTGPKRPVVRQIGQQLYLAAKSVKNHVSRLLARGSARPCARDRAQLVVFAHRSGLAEPAR